MGKLKLPDMEVEAEEVAGTPRSSHRASMKRTETPSDLAGHKEKPPSARRKPMKSDASKESKMASEQESKTVKTAYGFANMVWIQNLKKKKDDT